MKTIEMKTVNSEKTVILYPNQKTKKRYEIKK